MLSGTSPCPAGFLLSRRYTNPGGDIWAIPNLHGDIVATTGPTGSITSSGLTYDPYGQPLDPTTAATNTNAVPTTQTNGLTDAWEGAHQRNYEHTAGLNATLMGARLYLPTPGQFTTTDPVPGGNANDYGYPADPINGSDLTGQCFEDACVGEGLALYAVVAFGVAAIWAISYDRQVSSFHLPSIGGIFHMGKRPISNQGREQHKSGARKSTKDSHTGADGFGGRDKPNFRPSPTKGNRLIAKEGVSAV